MSCPKLAEGDVVRVTRVDSCGAPDEGAGNAFVDDCWVSVGMEPNVDEGVEIKFPSMSGRSCGNRRGLPTFNGFDITASFYSASPETIEMLTGNPVYDDWNGDPIGWDDCDVTGNFALEVWQNIVGEECPDDVTYQGFYWLLPWISNGRLGNITVASEGVTFELTGYTRANGRWSLGPWDVQAADVDNTPGPLLTEIGSGCHRRAFLTTIEPPTAGCEAILVPPVNEPVS